MASCIAPESYQRSINRRVSRSAHTRHIIKHRHMTPEHMLKNVFRLSFALVECAPRKKSISQCAEQQILLHTGTVFSSKYNFNCISNRRAQANVKSHITLASLRSALAPTRHCQVIGNASCIFRLGRAHKLNSIERRLATCIQSKHSKRNTNAARPRLSHIRFTGF